MNPELEITILMPCLNEAESIAGCVKEALGAIAESDVQGEVLIADNGSSDGSQEIAQSLGARVVDVKERGYGSALIGGIKAAKGKYILMGDADGSYNFGELPKFLAELKKGNDLVMGCRMPRGGGKVLPGAMPWKNRYIGNPILSFLGRLFFDCKVTDFHCGLRAFSREKILSLQLVCSGMELASEVVVKAVINKFKISEVPITLRPDARSKAPHLRPWRDGWRHLRFLLLFSPRWLFFYPGLFLMFIAIVAFGALTIGPVSIKGVTFDTNTLLASSAILVAGLQMVFSSVFAKIYCVKVGLMPETPIIKELLKSNPFELGIAVGLTLLSIGVLLLVAAFVSWGDAGFGNLTYPDTLRLVIPSITAISVGCQVIFGGFMIAVLGLE